MKRERLVPFVEEHLEKAGFSRGSWLWQPRSSQLILIIGTTLKAVSLKTSMTKTAIIFELGRLAGLAEAAGMKAKPAMQVFTGAGTWTKPNGLDQSEMFAGMPA
jgi:hypothetical protein